MQSVTTMYTSAHLQPHRVLDAIADAVFITSKTLVIIAIYDMIAAAASPSYKYNDGYNLLIKTDCLIV